MNILRQKYIIKQERVKRLRALDIKKIKQEEDIDFCVKLDYNKMKLDNEMLNIKINLIQQYTSWDLAKSENNEYCKSIQDDIHTAKNKLLELKSMKLNIDTYIDSKLIDE
tara:strand:- start:2335 stop:2664 length:330 start_codon:yes stop_codon:yes gene_type:complete